MPRYRKAIDHGLFAFILLTAACSNPTSPTDTTATVTPLTQLFAGTLTPLGSSVYPLSLVQASTVALTLASLTAGSSGAAAPAPMGLALGTTDEAGTCAHSDEAVVAPSLTTQLTVTAAAGTRCVEILDVGNLAGSANFVVRIVTTPTSGTLASPTTTAGSDSFSSNIPVLGSASRAIPASQAGAITVNLTSLAPATAVIGLGVGIPRTTGGGCYLTTSMNATTGTGPLTVPVDRGTYCVRVFDSGLLTTPATFTLTTAYP